MNSTPQAHCKPLTDPSCAICPLCGGPNGCQPAKTGNFAGTPCWCTTLPFSKALLDRVPVSQQGKACICQHCATTDTSNGT